MQDEVNEKSPMSDPMALDADEMPDIGLRFSDSDMDFARDSHDDSMEAYKKWDHLRLYTVSIEIKQRPTDNLVYIGFQV